MASVEEFGEKGNLRGHGCVSVPVGFLLSLGTLRLALLISGCLRCSLGYVTVWNVTFSRNFQ